MSDYARGLLLGLVGVVAFGLTLPATRIAVAEFDPVAVGIGRSAVAAIIAALILAGRRCPVPCRRHLPLIVVTAAGIVIGFPVLSAMAMKWAPASHGGVVLAVLPLTTAIAAVALAGERPSAGFWLCAVAGTGLVGLFVFDDGNTELHLADTLLVLAVISASIGYTTGGMLSRSLGGWQTICWTLVASLPVTLPVTAWLLADVNFGAGPAAWAAFAYVALVSQLFGFFAWNRAMVLAGVAHVGQLQLVQPFVTIAASVPLLGETVTWRMIAYAVLIAAIVGLGSRMRVARRAPDPAPVAAGTPRSGPPPNR